MRSFPNTNSPVFKHLHGPSVHERRRPSTSDGFRLSRQASRLFFPDVPERLTPERAIGREKEGRRRDTSSRCRFEANTTVSSGERARVTAPHGCWRLRRVASSSVMAVSASEPLRLPCVYQGALKGEHWLLAFDEPRSATCTPSEVLTWPLPIHVPVVQKHPQLLGEKLDFFYGVFLLCGRTRCRDVSVEDDVLPFDCPPLCDQWSYR